MINNCKNRNSQDSQRPMIHKYKKKGTREYNFSLFSGPAKQMISHCCDEPSNRFVLTNVSVEPIAIRGCFMRKQAPVFLRPTIPNEHRGRFSVLFLLPCVSVPGRAEALPGGVFAGKLTDFTR